MKCARPNCPNRARSSRNRGLCHKHYVTAPVRGYVDPTPSRERIKLLRERGMTLSMIAEQGVSKFGVRCIETQPRIRALTEQKVFAIPVPKPLRTRADVDATGTRRRIQALLAIGYTQALIAAELGVSQRSVSAFTHRDFVTAETRAAIAEVYSRWCMTPGPSRLSRDRAKAAGWVPPLAWDDIDDPAEKPQMPKNRLRLFPERLAELEYLNIPRSRMPEMLGIDRESFERNCDRHGVAS